MTSLAIHRRIPADLDRVWRALTTASELAAWLWPPTWSTTCEIDLRVGGRYRIAAPEYEVEVTGEYLEIEAPHRLVQSWLWSDDVNETTLSITLEQVADGVELTLTHESFPDDARRDSNLQGWNDCLDRLPGYVGSR